MASANGEWPFVKDDQGEDVGGDVVLDDNRFLAVRVAENPETGIRYAQVRLWEKQADGRTYKQRYGGDQGLTLGPDLVELYAKHLGEIAEMLKALVPVIGPAVVRQQTRAVTSSGPRQRAVTTAPAAVSAAPQVVRRAARRF